MKRARLFSALLSVTFLVACQADRTSYPLLKRGTISQLTRYTDSAGPYLLDWSDDGREIIFCEGKTAARISVDGGEPEVLYSLEDGYGRFSGICFYPGSTDSFAFIAERESDPDSKAIGLVAGGEVEWLYRAEDERMREVRFSPDGALLIFISSGGIKKIRLDDRSALLIPNDAGWGNVGLDYSISFLSSHLVGGYLVGYTIENRIGSGGSFFSLLKIPLGGGRPTVVHQFPEGSVIYGCDPSPDLNRYIFSGDLPTGGNTAKWVGIYLLTVDSGDIELIAEFNWGESARWLALSPDGGSIAFVNTDGDKPGNIHLIVL